MKIKKEKICLFVKFHYFLILLNVEKYNQKQTNKWRKDCYKAISEGRTYSMPQLAFYIFHKNYGYVAFGEKKALWGKTKKNVIDMWLQEEEKIKIRGW